MNRRVSLIVVNYGTHALVTNLLVSLATHPDRQRVEAILVDNGFPAQGDLRASVDPAAHPFPVRFVQNAAAGYASGVNQGAAVAAGEYLAIANSDLAWTEAPCLEPVIAALDAAPDVGIAGPQLVYPDRRWQRSHAPFPSMAEALRQLLFVDVALGAWASWRAPTRTRDVAYVDGAFLVVRRRCFAAVGGMDEAYGFYAEDCDLSWRAARLGWRRLFVPAGRLAHVRGASTQRLAREGYARKLYAAKRLFVERHFGARHARWYMGLTRLAVLAQAVVFTIAAALRRTTPWRERAASARAGARALWAG